MFFLRVHIKLVKENFAGRETIDVNRGWLMVGLCESEDRRRIIEVSEAAVNPIGFSPKKPPEGAAPERRRVLFFY